VQVQGDREKEFEGRNSLRLMYLDLGNAINAQIKKNHHQKAEKKGENPNAPKGGNLSTPPNGGEGNEIPQFGKQLDVGLFLKLWLDMLGRRDEKGFAVSAMQ